MTEFEYGAQIDRLKAVYGDKAYPDERVSMIWKKMKWRHPDVLEMAVDQLIADNQYAPLLNKILEAAVAAERAHPELRIDPYAEVRIELSNRRRESTQCHMCWGVGIITAYRKDLEGHPGEDLLCTCYSGRLAEKLPEYRGLPPWLVYYDHYYVLHTERVINSKALDAFVHIPQMPKEKRMDELARILKSQKQIG